MRRLQHCVVQKVHKKVDSSKNKHSIRPPLCDKTSTMRQARLTNFFHTSKEECGLNKGNTKKTVKSVKTNKKEQVFHTEARGQINVVTWNIAGLLGSLLDGEVVAFLKKFDFICIQETFLLYEFNTCFKFPEYKAIQSPASKLSKAGRPSGGVILLYKRKFENFITSIQTEVDNMLCIKINKELSNTENDIILITVYVHPAHSPYYKCTIKENTLELLDEFVGMMVEDNDWEDFLILGDVNSRLSNWMPGVMSHINTPDQYEKEKDTFFAP